MAENPTLVEDCDEDTSEPVSKPSWTKPLLHDEIEEVERTAEELGIDKSKLFNSFQKAELQELSDGHWLNLENADSRDETWTLEQIREHLAGERDFARIEEGILNGRPLPAPIVLFREGHSPYCIAGNSRLLVCRGMGLRPTVLAVYV